MRYYLEVRPVGKAPARLEISGRLVFVAREGAKVALPAEDCPNERHALEIEATFAGAQIQVPRGATGAFALNGEMRRSAVVPWVAKSFRRTNASKRTSRKSPVVVLGLVGILLCGGFALARKAEPERTGSEREPPALVTTPATCAATDPEATRRRARLAERTGLAQREQSASIAAECRFPSSPQGTEASNQWEQ